VPDQGGRAGDVARASGPTIGQVYALAAAIDQRYRALVLLGTFSSLRWGELAGLRRCDIDLAGRTVEVRRSLTERSGGSYFLGPPKSEAGRRRVVFPDVIVPDLQKHLTEYAEPEADGLVFTSPGGVQLRQSNFRRRVWAPALAEVGLPGVRFHDLRYMGTRSLRARAPTSAS
jgi:integrase